MAAVTDPNERMKATVADFMEIPDESGDSKVITRTVAISDPPADVWAILGAFDRLERWFDVEECEMIGDEVEGVGAQRRVEVAGRTYIEQVTHWRPESMLAYDIIGLPSVDSCKARWDMQGVGKGTLVRLTIATEPVSGMKGKLAYNMGLKKVLSTMAGQLIGNLKTRVESGRPV